MVQTEVIQVQREQIDPAILRRAATLLQRGQLVVFPTETVYGLGADALQAQAVEQIFAAKGRPYSDPLIVHIADQGALEALISRIPTGTHELIHAFWPGPLTLVLPASTHVPRLVSAGLPTVAIRMPGHPIARALIEAAGTPIAAPSANRFMHVSPTTAQHVLTDLQGRVPLILDGGPCEIGVESTVLDLCAAQPRILRPGGVSLEAIRAVLPEVQPPSAHPLDQDAEAYTSPGQMPIHYAPAVPTFLYEGPEEAMLAALLAETRKRIAEGEKVGVLLADNDSPAFQESGALIYRLGHTTTHIARHLFAGLRTLEEASVDVILCRSFNEEGLGLAIRDRLRKAAGGKVIDSSTFSGN